MELFFSHIIEFLSASFVSVVTWFCGKMYRRFAKDQDTMKRSILALNYDRLMQACRYHISQDEISPEELKNLEYLYVSYHELGGNGTGTALYKRCRDLKIRVEEKE